MNRKNLILLFCLFPFYFFGQSNYYTNSEATFINVRFLQGTDYDNNRYAQLLKKGQIIKLLPTEVIEYGFDNGQVFISKEIDIDNTNTKVFLEKLVDGKLTLYSFKEKNNIRFFVEKEDNQHIEITKNEINENYYKNVLYNLTEDYQIFTTWIDASKFSKNALIKLVNNYNSIKNGKITKKIKVTNLKPKKKIKEIPLKLSYGAILGWDQSKLKLPKFYDNKPISNLNFQNESSVLVGGFIDFPIPIKNFTLHCEAYYSKHSYSYSSTYQVKTYYFASNQTELSLPILLRYHYEINKKAVIYVNGGGIYKYNISNNCDYLEVISTSASILILEAKDESEGNFISTHNLGYSLGLGIQLNILNNKQIFIECRYNSLYGIEETNFSNTKFQILSGIKL